MRLTTMLLLTCLLGCSAPPETNGQWLSVAATREQASEAVAVARDLRSEWPAVTIVKSDDCAGFRTGMLVVGVPSRGGRAAADETTNKLKSRFADAYSRECKPVPGSALAAGLLTVDPSIFRVPADTVNWNSSDMVSTVQRQDGGYLWIRRWYDPVPNDPLEGRRVSVFLKRDDSQPKQLLARCSGAEAVFGDGHVAVSCEKQVAGNDLLHSVSVFDLHTGNLLETTDRCRNPHFESSGKMVCEPESAGPK